MKAMVLNGHGGPEMLRYGDAQDPKPAPVRSWSMFMRPASMPPTTKCGLAGRAIISAFRISWAATSPAWLRRGAGVTDFAVGDAVFGVLDAGIEGAYAEKLAIKAAIVARKPDRLSHQQAAAMALTSLTAIWAIEDTAQLKAGETILIQGGAGGVAGFAIQLAKHLGATVITTASAANVDYVRSLGADRVIDYNVEDFTKTVSDCDVVFDTVGGEVQMRSYGVLKPVGGWSGSRRHRRDRSRRAPMSRSCARPSPVTARILSASWRCWRPARSGRRLSRDTISQTPPRRTGSAKAVICGASWFSRFAERSEIFAGQVGSYPAIG